MTDYSIVRDWYDRPYVTSDGSPLQYASGRKSPVNAEPYTRISTLSGTLDDKQGLVDWAAARAMMGTVKNAAIAAQISHLISAHDDPWSVSEAKKPLKQLVQKAMELGGSADAAGLGTAFHGLTECIDRGEPPAYVPADFAPWIEARQIALEDFEPVLIEPFIVNDELRVAGNPDRYLRHKQTGVVYAADDKTGTSEPAFPLKVTVQVAIASRGVLYDQSTGERTPIECSQDLGILIHTPIRDGEARCDLYWLDLTLGWELAQLSALVRAARKVPKLIKVSKEWKLLDGA